MPYIFDINAIFFEYLGYKMSYLEFLATLTGGVAVWLSALENIWSWIIGLINVSLAFIMFYQIQLYPDMFLQVFFFITNITGFYMWKFPKANESNLHKELKITKLSPKNILILLLVGLTLTAILGKFSSNLSQLFPKLFSLPTAFPYLDSFTTVMSIIATFLLMRKKLEAWALWLFIDLISTFMYYQKEVKMYSLLYFIFCIVAVVGTVEWNKRWKRQNV